MGLIDRREVMEHGCRNDHIRNSGCGTARILILYAVSQATSGKTNFNGGFLNDRKCYLHRHTGHRVFRAVRRDRDFLRVCLFQDL